MKKVTMDFCILVTRGDAQKLLIESYLLCKVRISRNTKMEKLFLTRRTAKINARRKSIALNEYVAPLAVDRSTMLFKEITNKPFMTRRRSVSTRITRANSDKNDADHRIDTNKAAEGTIAVSDHQQSNVQVHDNRNKAIDEEAKSNSVSENDDELHPNNEIHNTKEVIEQTTTQSTVSGGPEHSSSVPDVDKENDAPLETILLPFLPPVVIQNDVIHTMRSTILDSNMPSMHNLPKPIMPIAQHVDVEEDLIQMDLEVSQAILDCSVPDLLDLPAPIVPIHESQQTKRAIPSLIPICDMKKYGPTKKMTKTSRLILSVLNKFDRHQLISQQSTLAEDVNITPAEEVNITIDFESDESIGRLYYSSDSE